MLECLIRISLEIIEKYRNEIKEDAIKTKAFVNTHARAIQISNEILSLLKAGYADGAIARWRSLHELTVIALFLKDNNAEVSQRYMDHAKVKGFKEAVDYETHCNKLGYAPFGEREFDVIKKSKEQLCQKYNDRFQDDYGWIPSTIMKNRNFRELEKRVKLEQFRPLYNFSSNAVHGGAKGFYRLGLMDEKQDAILLVGPSNYGFADPLQNTAVSLMHITLCMLSFCPNFETITFMHTIRHYVEQIAKEAVKVQFAIEKDEKRLNLKGERLIKRTEKEISFDERSKA